MIKSTKRLTQVTWLTLFSFTRPSPSVGVFLTFTPLVVLNLLRKPHLVVLKGTKYFQATTIINKSIIPKEIPDQLGQRGSGTPVAPQPPGIQSQEADTVAQDAAQIQLRLHTNQHAMVRVHRRRGQSLWWTRGQLDLEFHQKCFYSL